MTVLITGGSGTLGSELKKIFSNSLCPSHDELDICNKNKVFEFFKNNDIDMIIHTAAATKIRKCEDDKPLAMQVNVNGTKNLVNATLEFTSRGKFVYISTACVFDGHTGMYTEKSIPYPENFYSLTKLLGEYQVTKISNNLIIRTNFVSRKKWSYQKAFTDRFGTYLFSDQVAQGIFDVCKNNLDGIVHVVGDKKISMYELARLTTPEIQPMTMSDYVGPRLTIDMSLDTEKWKKYRLN